MLTDWRNWCRLCGKSENAGIEIFLKLESLFEMSPNFLQKYLMLIQISPFDGMPASVCETCFQFASNIEKFADRCIRVEKMYSELVFESSSENELDLQNIRFRYGLDVDEKPFDMQTTMPLVQEIFKVDQATDTFELPEDESSFIKEEFNDISMSADIGVKRTRVCRRKKVKTSVYVNQDDGGNSDEDFIIEEHNAYEEEQIEAEEENAMEAENEEFLDSDDDKPLKTRTERTTKKKISTFKCSECEKSYSRWKLREQHMAAKHPSTEPINSDLPYVCSTCSKRFATEKKVKLHEAVHLPQEIKMVHPCPYCDKKFSKSVNVQAHIRAIHIGDRPFICEECGKSFGTKGGLKEHQITHSEERPYECSYCQKKFKNLPRLKTHEDIHNDTIYVCPHCGIQLNTKRTLKMHMVVHSDHKKYKCHYCGNEYKRSKALKNHLILHTGLRPYMCPFCDKTFANGSNCRSHKKKAHPHELAAMEAAGEQSRATNIPKLEHLQPKKSQLQILQEQQDQELQHQQELDCAELIQVDQTSSNGIQQTASQSSIIPPMVHNIVSPTASIQTVSQHNAIQIMQEPHSSNNIMSTNNL